MTDHPLIEPILAEFRGWLTELFAARPDAATVPTDAPKPIDLATVVSQFTALRQEVILQTKTSRSAVEQTAEALKLATGPKADPDEIVKPLAKALIDIADAMTLSIRQIEKSRETLEPLLDELPDWSLPDPPATSASVTSPAQRSGLVARLLGSAPPHEPDQAWKEWAEEVLDDSAERIEKVEALRDTLAPLLAGLGDGYAMSLRRIERVLPQFGLEAISAVGEPFDPELMEAVEMVEAEDVESGTVVEEVRRGYRWKNTIFRFAQVKVAR